MRFLGQDIEQPKHDPIEEALHAWPDITVVAPLWDTDGAGYCAVAGPEATASSIAKPNSIDVALARTIFAKDIAAPSPIWPLT